MAKIYTTELVLTPGERNILISILMNFQTRATVKEIQHAEIKAVENLLRNITEYTIEHDHDEWREELFARIEEMLKN